MDEESQIGVYSGRTTALEHKNDRTWTQADISKVKDCIQTATIFDVQWSNCPVEVQDDVRSLWRNRDLGNDDHYVRYDKRAVDNGEWDLYPEIVHYLNSRGVTTCLIHWWW